jgi:hypothetical protein
MKYNSETLSLIYFSNNILTNQAKQEYYYILDIRKYKLISS